MKADRILFPTFSWLLLLLIPFTFFGFYPSYFSKLFSPMANIFHVHAFFMSLWVIIAIVQPFLISRKKFRLHRFIGKLSYLLMPVVLITGWMVIRYSYYNRIQLDTLKAGSGLTPLDTEAIINTTKENIIIGIVYLTWLAIFYLLAVINRKRMVFHATYMCAAILTLLGPTVDRIIFQVYEYYGLTFNFFAEVAVFLLIDILLLALLWFQWRKGYSLKATIASLAIYIAGQLAYFFLPGTAAWKNFVAFVL